MMFQKEQRPYPGLFHWKNLMSAASNFAFGLLYLLAYYRDISLWGLTRKSLTIVMQLECLAVITFPFIIYILYLKEVGLWDKIKKLFYSIISIAAFIYSSYLIGGAFGMLGYLIVAGNTFMGFLLNLKEPDRTFELGFRWMVTLISLLGWAQLLDISSDINEWIGRPEILILGLAYFFTLSIFEFFGLFQSRFKEKIKSILMDRKNQD